MFPPLAPIPRRLSWVLILVVLALVVGVARAADPTVRAHLSRGISVIGDPVELQIRVTGAKRISDPPDVTVDGLDVRFVNRGSESVVRIEGGNFNTERTTTLGYSVAPQRNGTFTIPPISIEADGKIYRTQPVTLTVQPSSATDGAAEVEKIAFAEFAVAKKSAYIGEAIPVELRLYVDPRVSLGEGFMPEIGGEGFTKQKMPRPDREDVEKNGREYVVTTFKTLISPIRAGKITVGPSEFDFQARIPRARRGGPRDPFDILGDIMGDYTATQEVKIKATAVDLTVKPLPQAGKPADFFGAVGTFQFSAEGSPKLIKFGDPVTMKLKITGRGNFDGVTAPVLTDLTGWRAYPPSSKFSADDPVNHTGTKTFEMALIPEAKKTTMPLFAFSYFDPGTEKYVTLKSEAAPLVVEGEAPPALAPSATAEEPKKPEAEARPNDIVGLRYDRDEPQDFAPIYERREFWLVQGAAGLVLLGLVALRVRRRPDAAVRQKAALRHEKDAVWRRLRGADLGHVEFFDAAARLAQIETSLATGRAADGIDAAAVRSTAKLDEASAEAIEDVFNARAELHFAGGGGGDRQVSAADRQRVLEALRQLEKGHARN